MNKETEIQMLWISDALHSRTFLNECDRFN